MKKRVFLIFVLIVFLGGCTSIVNQRGNSKILDEKLTSQIVQNKTTKSELLSLLGAPQSMVQNADGTQIWTYSFDATKLSEIAGEVENIEKNLVITIKRDVITEIMEGGKQVDQQTLAELQKTPEQRQNTQTIKNILGIALVIILVPLLI